MNSVFYSKFLEKPESNLPQNEVSTGWSVLGLAYSVQWPLHIFFTPAILEK